MRDFTDAQLNEIVRGPSWTMPEKALAQTIIDDREAFQKLREEIEPLAQQIICPADNTFRRQVTLIDARLHP